MQQRRERNNKLFVLITAALVAILVAAWIDGGEEPLREIVTPVEVKDSL